MKRFLSALLARWSDRRRRAGLPAPPRTASETMSGQTMLDCEAVMRQLWDYLDGELTADRMAAIRAHLELCKRCYPQYEFERSFLDAVAARQRQHSDQEGLRSRVQAALRSQGLSDA